MTSSVVRVPVLSKQQKEIFPANGIRNGSVQKMPDLVSRKSDVLTASVNSMGSSGGTTDVSTRVHSKNNFRRLRSGSFRP
jgi:hypothetical protein